jgi:hypothetical protein
MVVVVPAVGIGEHLNVVPSHQNLLTAIITTKTAFVPNTPLNQLLSPASAPFLTIFPLAALQLLTVAVNRLKLLVKTTLALLLILFKAFVLPPTTEKIVKPSPMTDLTPTVPLLQLVSVAKLTIILAVKIPMVTILAPVVSVSVFLPPVN